MISRAYGSMYIKQTEILHSIRLIVNGGKGKNRHLLKHNANLFSINYKVI